MENIEKNEVEKEEKEQYTQLKENQIPTNGSYRGNKEDFGKSGRSFKFYVNGVDLSGKDKVIEIPLKTPKNRHMIKYILLASKMGKLKDMYDTDVDFLDLILDFLQNYYEVPETFMDRIDPVELMNLVGFTSVISVSPSRDKA